MQRGLPSLLPGQRHLCSRRAHKHTLSFSRIGPAYWRATFPAASGFSELPITEGQQAQAGALGQGGQEGAPSPLTYPLKPPAPGSGLVMTLLGQRSSELGGQDFQSICSKNVLTLHQRGRISAICSYHAAMRSVLLPFWVSRQQSPETTPVSLKGHMSNTRPDHTGGSDRPVLSSTQCPKASPAPHPLRHCSHRARAGKEFAPGRRSR